MIINLNKIKTQSFNALVDLSINDFENGQTPYFWITKIGGFAIQIPQK